MAGKLAGSSGRSPPTVSLHDLVAATLGRLAEDDALLQTFLAETGQDPLRLRRDLSQPSVQAGVLDFLVNNDGLIVAVAQALGRSPDEIAAVAKRMVARPGDGYF